ncbi:MAG: N-6 DNA methylase, partial [bacterium]|nr:N-6 DNA methylase [bacterium]
MPGLTQPTLFDLFNTRIFPLSENVASAIEELANNNSAAARGAIYTRVEVVEFILDLVGYVSNKPIYQGCILEPSFGSGDFLFIIVDRMIESWKHHSKLMDVKELNGSIRAVELHRKSFEDTRHTLINQLEQHGFTEYEAIELAGHWLIQGDFLLETPEKQFDYAVGNPPYVRQELIPVSLLEEYRHRFATMYDRADLYIPFIEKSLSMLKREGVLGFICADRWMKNRYGGPLRRLVYEEYSLKIYVDMADTDA